MSIRLNERPPTRLAMQISRPTGRKARWGPDEPDAENVPTGLSFTTKMPGGFGDLTVNLGRDAFSDRGDLNPFDDVHVYGPGIQTAWRGRGSAFPRDTANRSVAPAAVGYAAHLGDDPSAAEIYADRDLSHFIDPPSTSRQIAFAAVTVRTNEGSAVVARDEAGDAAVVQGLTRITGNLKEIQLAYYNAHGVAIGSLYYDLSSIDPGAGDKKLHPSWVGQITAARDDNAAGEEASGNILTAGTGPFLATYTPTNSDNKYLGLQLYYNAATGALDGDWKLLWRRLCVYGRHGLTKRGSAPQGFYGHDIMANIVSRWAPLLNYSTGANGSIQDDPDLFVLPHFVIGRDRPITAAAAILQLNAFWQYDWGVYGDREFFWRPPDTDATTWIARRSEGHTLKLEGVSADAIFNGVVVHYTDPTGVNRSVGPTGSDSDTTSDYLLDSSEANLATAAGIERRWGQLEISQVTTAEGALQVGRRWLIEAQRKNQQGQIVLRRDVVDTSGRRLPVWAVNAGDWVKVGDGDDVRRKIISTNYSHDGLTLTADLDMPSARLDALMERMGVVLVGVTT